MNICCIRELFGLFVDGHFDHAWFRDGETNVRIVDNPEMDGARPLSSIERFLFARGQGGMYKAVASTLRLQKSTGSTGSTGGLDLQKELENMLMALLIVTARIVNLRCTVWQSPRGPPCHVLLPCRHFGLTDDNVDIVEQVKKSVSLLSSIHDHPLLKANVVKFVHRSSVNVDELWKWNKTQKWASTQPDYVNLPPDLQNLESAHQEDVVLNKVLEACNEHLFDYAAPCEDADTIRSQGLKYCLWTFFVLYDDASMDLIWHYGHEISDGRSGFIFWEQFLQAWQDLLNSPVDTVGNSVLKATRPHYSLDEALGSALKMSTSRMITDLYKLVILPKSLQRKFYPSKHWVGPEQSVNVKSKETIVKSLDDVIKWPTRCTLVSFPKEINGELFAMLLKRATKQARVTLHGLFLAAGAIATAQLARKVGHGYLTGKDAYDKKHLVGQRSTDMITIATGSPACLRKFGNTGKKPSGIPLPDKYMGAFVSELHATVSFSIASADSIETLWAIARSMTGQVHKEMESGEALELLASTKFITGDWSAFIAKMRAADPKGMSYTFTASNVRAWTFPSVDGWTPVRAGFTQTAGVPAFAGIDICTMNDVVTAFVNSRPGVYGGEGYLQAFPASVPEASEWLALQEWISNWKRLVIAASMPPPKI